MTHHQFKAARATLGHTQATLSKALDKTPRTIRRYESGECVVPLTVEMAMAWLKHTRAMKNEVIGM